MQQMKILPSTLLERVGLSPMMVALAATALGVLFAEHFAPPLWSVVLGFVVCVGMAIVRYGNSYGKLYLFLALAFAGGMSMCLRQNRLWFDNESRTIHIKIAAVSNPTPSTQRAEGEVKRIDGLKCDLKVRINAAEGVELRRGEEIVVKARIREFGSAKGSDVQDRYEQYMVRQGFKGQIFLRKEMIIERHESPLGMAQRAQQMAHQKIQRLGLSESVEAVVLTMAIGDRSQISTSLRRHYTRSGGAHLLAVSGLHVGYIFALINLLLLPVALLRRGQVIRAVVAIGVIWAYATMTGLAPSTTRAAVMFSLLQLSLMTASRYNSLNALCLTAMVMLLWRGNNIHDAGFLLSMLAVFAIVEWAMPAIRHIGHWHALTLEQRLQLRSQRFRWMLRSTLIGLERWLLSSLIISLAATLITMPLSSYLFGQISLWSVVTAPIMIPLGGVVVALAMIYILMPASLLQGVMGWCLETVGGWMNSLAEWCSQTGVIAYEIEIGLWSCWAIYIIYGVASGVLRIKKRAAQQES